MLRALALGVVGVAALLAAMLSLNRLFANDYRRWYARTARTRALPVDGAGARQNSGPLGAYRPAASAALAAAGVATAITHGEPWVR